MKKLSVFYIVRNEQDRIVRSIKSIKSLADEVIIVDTGSVDRTIDVCKALKCKIYKYKWNDDFSSARNFALSKCNNDLVMYLDADEILTKKSTYEIEKLLSDSKKNVAYYVNITDCISKEGSDEFIPLNEKNSKSSQIRIFTKGKHIKFKGLANENIEDSIYRDHKCVVLNSDVEIMHNFLEGRNKDLVSKKKKYHEKISGKPVNMTIKNNPVSNPVAEPKKEKKCAIVICAYNLIHATKKCIESVVANTKFPYKLILVDDGSSNNCSTYMKSIKGANYIRIDKNSGVPKSRNRAMRVAARDEEVEYICLLDNDTEVYDGWLTKLISNLIAKKCELVGR
jgi:glycosyltransferase involved in cell wall biosynthesis